MDRYFLISNGVIVNCIVCDNSDFLESIQDQYDDIISEVTGYGPGDLAELVEGEYVFTKTVIDLEEF